MFGFVDILKAVAAVLITNSHLGGVWPVSSLAFGGMLGDVLFFTVSGFCLYHIKVSFPVWYLKRIFRIYPVVIIVTGISLLVGFMHVNSFWEAINLFVYPTYYHFIASIMLLYIFYYVLIWFHRKTGFRLENCMLIVFVIELICYFAFYDKSVYHIDVVEEYMARFLFLESMLLGAYFRKRMDENKINIRGLSLGRVIILLVFGLIAYFGSAVAFRKFSVIAPMQILSHVIVFALLWVIMYLCCSIEAKGKIKLDNIPGKVIKHLSKITLEIYLTQYLVYYLMPDFPFPLNLLLIILAILIVATVVNLLCNFITKRLNLLLEKKHDQ